MSYVITSSLHPELHALYLGPSGAPPAGWEQVGFDDSAWPLAVISADDARYTVITGAHIMAAFSTDPDAGARFLLRHHFVPPAGVPDSATLSFLTDDRASIYLNGALLATQGSVDWIGPTVPPIQVPVPPAMLLPNQVNVLAFDVTNDVTDPTPIGGAVYQLQVTAEDSLTTGTAEGATAGAGAPASYYGARLGPAVRLFYPEGTLDWEHDGTIWRVRSAGRTVLQAPFPVLARQPAAVLGQDPATGLPMWTGQHDSAPPPPPPPPVSRTYGKPDRSLQDTHTAPDPLPVPPNAQRVCGAAEAMAKLACAIYDAVVQIINKAKNDIIADFTQGLKAQISAELVSLLTEGEFAAWLIDAVQLALTILAQIVETLLNWGTNLPLIWPPNPLGHPTSQQYLFVRCAAWQALWLTGGDYLSENKSADGLGTRDYWQQYLAPQWSFFAGSTQSGINQANPPWQLVWINAIIARVADAGWAFAAAKGAEEPSTGCTGCAGYPT